jgi:hypothetical protein
VPQTCARPASAGLRIALAAAGVVAAAALAAPADDPPPPVAAMALAHPGLRVLEAADLRGGACRHDLGSHPGWVAADFQGDGRLDFGVLLVDRKPSRIVRFDGQDYPVYTARVLALLARAGGGYEERALYDYSDALPTIRGLALQAPRRIRDVETERSRTLTQPALSFVSCGQFTVVYAWDGKDFTPVKVADQARVPTP